MARPESPQVGARGQRAQQRILEAALQMFGEHGYHQTGVDRITRAAGCSRATFYQHFSGKEEMFRHLAGQLARQVDASIEALDPLTADAAGWTAIRAWVTRFAAIYDRYEPVFQVFLTSPAASPAQRHIAGIRSRLATTTRPPRRLDPTIGLLLECLARTFADLRIIHLTAPAAHPDDQIGDAIADVVHRSLFGRHDHANVHTRTGPHLPALAFGPATRAALERARDDATPTLSAGSRQTLHALMDAGHHVFVTHGYHRARIDDVAAAAGVSHGVFYRYFDSKDQFALVLAARAMRKVSTTFMAIPEPTVLRDPTGRAMLRRWLRRYNALQTAEAAIIRVWVDAARHDPDVRADSAAALDLGRRRLAQFLRPRSFGDPDTDAVVMVGLLGAYGAHARPAASVDAAAHIIERGFLGR